MKENKESPKNQIVAEVGFDSLTSSELTKIFGKDWRLKKEKVSNFIKIWLKDKAIAIEAEKVLSNEDKDFSKEINSYKNSLLKYTYEQKMLDTALSLSVSEEEILGYFKRNKKNFELKENIVRVRYVKVPKNHKKFNRLRYMIQYKDSTKKEKFFNLIRKENIFCEANDSLWQKLDDLKNLIPFKLYNDEHFLRNYNYTEAPDGEFIWILYFTENRLKNGNAPIETVKEKIIAIILNNRKQELVQKIGNSIYKKGINNGEIKVYFEGE
ncbi:MAG: hypothetical protein CMD18_08585 [Flavobacteriales bacterium]|nr:hypothetical protein [Flavobacteriales bacterium]|tara:strand:- start:6365 stop:7168 length:804 start_codon:yes stop_codon:yes gene_type:complete